MAGSGGLEHTNEEQRDGRGLPALEGVMQDLRYTMRTLQKDRGFAAFAILIIALGIGASSTVFSVLDALLVKPLPFKDPARLVWIANRTKIDGDLSGATLQVGRFLDYRQAQHFIRRRCGILRFLWSGRQQADRQRRTGAPEHGAGIAELLPHARHSAAVGKTI